MGLFSTKKIIRVSSTVYNLAGDETPRPDYLKSVVLSAVMNPSQPNLADSIVNNYINGPGGIQRRFFQWCDSQDYCGVPDAQIDHQYAVNTGIVSGEIPLPPTPLGVSARCSNAFISSGDFTPFVDQYVYANHPELVGTEYLSEYYLGTHEILISYEDLSTEIISAGEYDVNSQFLVAYYNLYLDNEVQDSVTGSLVTGVVDPGDLPDLTGYSLDSMTNMDLVTYIFDDLSTEDFTTVLSIYTKTEYLGGTGDETTTTRTTQISIWEYRYVVDGDHLEAMYDYRIDYQDVLSSKFVGDPQVYIYKIGGENNTLNGLANSGTVREDKEFYPLIPLRLNNVSIQDPIYADTADGGNNLYRESYDAYRRMTNNAAKLDDLIGQVEDNPDLKDIDYAYIQFGVSLNASDTVAKKYMYRFFKELMGSQLTDETQMGVFIDQIGGYAAALAELDAWIAGQTDPLDPLYGTAKPDVPVLQSPGISTLKLQCSDPRVSSSDMRLSWINISEEVHGGLGKEDAKVGDLWFVKETPLSYSIKENHYLSKVNTIEKISLYWQTSTGSYKKLVIYGLIHQNFIYGGKFVETSAYEALDDTDPSGFLVPMHQPTVQLMGIKDATQLTMSNTYIVFNCYRVFKRKWYQRFLGLLLIILFIVVAGVLFSPATFANAGGILGTNTVIGTSLGLTGVSAILVGAVANTLAAITVSMLISQGAIALFGEKWGPLIGAILGFLFSFGLSGGFNGNMLQNLFTPTNLLKLSDALAQGVQGIAQYEVGELQEESEAAKVDYEAKMKELLDRLSELNGNDLIFDPMQLTGITTGNGLGIGLYLPETSEEFIQRTLMVGSDMYDLTLGFIENFTRISLTLPDQN